jgi:hypothetical protein
MLKRDFDMRGKPISSARFLNGSYFVASVDVKGTVRIWNYRTE